MQHSQFNEGVQIFVGKFGIEVLTMRSIVACSDRCNEETRWRVGRRRVRVNFMHYQRRVIKVLTQKLVIANLLPGPQKAKRSKLTVSLSRFICHVLFVKHLVKINFGKGRFGTERLADSAAFAANDTIIPFRSRLSSHDLLKFLDASLKTASPLAFQIEVSIPFTRS